MQREINFRHFYKSDISQSLIYTEKERKTIVTKIIISIVLPIVVAPILFILWQINRNELLLVPALILIIGSPIYINRLFGDTLFYKNFKRKIIGKIIKYINPTLEYDNLQKVDDVEYDNSKFFDNTNTVLYGDDHISGMINDVRIEFSEFLAEYKLDADKKNYGTKFQFRGMFLLGEFRKNFPCEFVIKTSSLGLPGAEPIGVDAAFNKLFKTKIISNPANLDQVLTLGMKNLITKLHQQIHNDFMISFADNRIYIGIYHDEDLFEPTLFHSMNNYDKMKGFFDDLYYPILFIEEATKEIVK